MTDRRRPCLTPRGGGGGLCAHQRIKLQGCESLLSVGIHSLFEGRIGKTRAGERGLVTVVLESPDNSQRALDMRTMRIFVEAEEAFNRDFSDAVPYELF